MKLTHGARGQILPLIALSLVALMGMATLAIDVGYYRYQQRLEQSAADSAALAGGIQLIYSSANMVAAGRAAATQNGFADDAGVTTNVTISNPPTSGAYTGNARAVEAIVKRKQPIFFGGILGAANMTVTARAVAAPNNTTAGCLYTMSTSSGIRMTGSGSGIYAPGCGILSNADITLNGNGSVTASSVGYAQASSVSCTGCITPPAQIVPFGDPCLAIVGCAYLEANPSPSLTKYATTTCASCTLPSGEYTKAITISGTSTLSGFYQFDLGVTITGNVTGTNLTLYNKAGSNITLSGSETTNLAAPTSGSYAGLLIYQPPAVTGNITFNGNAGANTWTGMVYTPGVDLTTNGSEPSFSALIVNSLTDHGHNITLTGTGLQNSTETNHFVLVE